MKVKTLNHIFFFNYQQHEKGKPLVNLVDNMVKLGSLYRNGTPTSGLLGSSSMQTLSGIPVRERLEFNFKVQEQRLLAEERRDWDRLSPDYGQLQVLYMMCLFPS